MTDQPLRCVHCGLEVEDVAEPGFGGQQPPRWAHYPGRYSICYPQQPNSPYALPATATEEV